MRAAVVVNTSVTGMFVLPDLRSWAAIVKRGIPIPPESTPTDASVSVSVCTVMPVALPAVAAPIVKPRSVMVKVVFALMPAMAVVMTIAVAVGAAQVAVMAFTEVAPVATVGVAVVAKNPEG